MTHSNGAALPSRQTDTFVFWSHNEGPGWTYLLPVSQSSRLLCLDARDGAVAWALSRQCEDVVQLKSGRDWPAAEPRPGSITASLTTVDLDELVRQCEGAGFRPFDGIVIHDPLGERIHHDSLALMEKLLGSADNLLCPDGWIYLGVANPSSLQRWRNRLRRASEAGHRALPLGTLKRLLRTAGAREIRHHPYLLAHGRVSEVIPAIGYRATRNHQAWGERLKECLFGAWGARHFAPAAGLLGLRNPGTLSTLDQLLQRIGTLRSGPLPSGERAVLKQYLVFSGHKAIISAGPALQTDQDVVAVLTADTVSTRGRTAEARQLEALSRIPAIAPLVPRSLARFELGQARCFAIERVPGVTIDHDLPDLEKVTDAALEFLVLLHHQTAEPFVLDHEGLARLVQPILDAAAVRNPDYTAHLAAWQPALGRMLSGMVMPAVYQHGDFKIENVIYEPDTCRLMSIIDWEHARRPGLPVLDLLYLLVYNRIIRGAEWPDAIERLIVNEEWTPREKQRLDRYLSACSLSPVLLRPMRALFLAHHLGCRIHLPADSPLRGRIGTQFGQFVSILADQPVETTR